MNHLCEPLYHRDKTLQFGGRTPYRRVYTKHLGQGHEVYQPPAAPHTVIDENYCSNSCFSTIMPERKVYIKNKDLTFGAIV